MFLCSSTIQQQVMFSLNPLSDRFPNSKKDRLLGMTRGWDILPVDVNAPTTLGNTMCINFCEPQCGRRHKLSGVPSGFVSVMHVYFKDTLFKGTVTCNAPYCETTTSRALAGILPSVEYCCEIPQS